ncbi:uncharacterized protein P8A3.02c [Nymphaea colorata]|nr:uncharacterized protein P8A3.02c [Nymphaea colorata]
MELDDQKSALREVFGDSSDGEPEGEEDHPRIVLEREHNPPAWEKVEGINGLWICENFLSPCNQISLLHAIQQEGWFSEQSHNQAMRFGDLPNWAIELSCCIHEAVYLFELNGENHGHLTACAHCKVEEHPFPADLLWREPLFDQMIVNVYHPGEGICSHVDLMRFDDGIAIISLESDCVMHFTLAKEASSSQKGKEEDKGYCISDKVPVLLKPGSLVLMSGEARYLWKHEINRKPGFQVWEGREIGQQKRTSVTLRRLCVTG